MSDKSYIGKANIIVTSPYANKLYSDSNRGDEFPPPETGFLIQDNGFDLLQDNGYQILYIA